MAKATEEHVTSAGLDENAYEWETVHEEAPDQIVFTDVGDTYVGTYTGSEEIDPRDPKDPDKRFTQLRFRDNEGLKVINAGYELRETFAKIEPGTVARIRLVKFVDVGEASPMKSFRIDTASGRANQKG